MRRLAALLLLICFTATPVTGKSMQMFSIERGNVYAENFSLNHILKYASTGSCPINHENHARLAPVRNYNHSHVILLNSLSREYNEDLRNYVNTILVPFSFDAASNRFIAPQALSGLSFTRLKLLPPSRLPFQQFTVLLI